MGREQTRERMTTLCYIEKEDAYLMMHRIKKEVDINKDKWIGVGGHFEADESPEECLLREVKEETGLTLKSWRFRWYPTPETVRMMIHRNCMKSPECFRKYPS